MVCIQFLESWQFEWAQAGYSSMPDSNFIAMSIKWWGGRNCIDVVGGQNISNLPKMRFFENAITFDPGILQMSNYAYFVRADLLNRNLAKNFMWHVWIQFYSNFRSKISRAPILRRVCGNCNFVKMAHARRKLFWIHILWCPNKLFLYW